MVYDHLQIIHQSLDSVLNSKSYWVISLTSYYQGQVEFFWFKSFKLTFKVIGHGAFGEVLKVKNKLDLRIYAIKRIRINPTSKHNKQITREIKLLSRLNHENVVRYKMIVNSNALPSSQIEKLIIELSRLF